MRNNVKIEVRRLFEGTSPCDYFQLWFGDCTSGFKIPDNIYSEPVSEQLKFLYDNISIIFEDAIEYQTKLEKGIQGVNHAE